MGKTQLKQVTKSFGDTQAIPPLDLTIEDGEFTVFVGPSGCGNSTLLRMIAGLEDLTSGSIEIDDKDATDTPPAKRGLAMVFQSYALYPHMSVRKNIAFPLRMAKMDKAEQDRRIEAAAAALNLTDKIVVLQAGVIEQVGSPLELYHTPCNLFVAGFIGSSKMNLIDGPEAAKHDAQTIGIRPEHIDVSATDGIWKGRVGVAEYLGSDTFFHVHDTGLADMITVRAAGEVSFNTGDMIQLTPRVEQMRRFDGRGLRIA